MTRSALSPVRRFTAALAEVAEPLVTTLPNVDKEISHGRLVIGPKFCDPTKKPEKQVGCVQPGGARF